MQNGEINDSQISASSSSTNLQAWRARLNRRLRKAWCTIATELLPQFLQIDLREIKTVSYIATQGLPRKEAWVTSYSLEYSADGTQWMEYKETGRHTRVRKGFVIVHLSE